MSNNQSTQGLRTHILSAVFDHFIHCTMVYVNLRQSYGQGQTDTLKQRHENGPSSICETQQQKAMPKSTRCWGKCHFKHTFAVSATPELVSAIKTKN